LLYFSLEVYRVGYKTHSTVSLDAALIKLSSTYAPEDVSVTN